MNNWNEFNSICLSICLLNKHAVFSLQNWFEVDFLRKSSNIAPAMQINWNFWFLTCPWCRCTLKHTHTHTWQLFSFSTYLIGNCYGTQHHQIRWYRISLKNKREFDSSIWIYMSKLPWQTHLTQLQCCNHTLLLHKTKQNKTKKKRRKQHAADNYRGCRCTNHKTHNLIIILIESNTKKQKENKMSDSTKLDEVRRKMENWWENERNTEVDIFRDTAARYCGYANEVGESFRPLIPRSIVHFSYAIAIVYVIGDCVDKTIKTYRVSCGVWRHVVRQSSSPCQTFPKTSSQVVWFVLFQRSKAIGGKRIGPAAKIAGDVFLWQMFASVIIPGVVINRITWGAGKLCNNSNVKGLARKWAPTCIGLAAIPFIIRPIDTAVDEVMDKTYRKYV